MNQDPLTLYKLIILYMLNQVQYSLTKTHISNFILDHEYTDYPSLQQAFADLEESNFISSKPYLNRTHMSITEEGISTIDFFHTRISEAIKKDIRDFILQNQYEIKNETNVTAHYYRHTSKDYHAVLSIKEKDEDLLNITLSVPNQTLAEEICANWQTKNQAIYHYLTQTLF